MRKKSAKDENSRFLKSVSPTISAWVQRVLQEMSNPLSNRTLKNLLRGSESMNYENIMYIYGWIMEDP